MRIASLFAVLTVGAFAYTLADAGQNQGKVKPAGELPEIKELPNPFVFADGKPVRDAKDWELRRVEIKKLLEQYEYGHMPPKPEKITVKKGERQTDANGGFTQTLTVTMEHKGKTFNMTVNVAVPAVAKGQKAPVLIQNGGGGGKGGGQYGKRGFATASFSWNSAAKDNAKSGGIYVLFGSEIDTGTLMGWAWGISRCIDALAEAIPEIDITKVFVTGHSRDGKATLVAGAFDDRIALTIPSHSGAGGVPPYRFNATFSKRNGNAETLQAISKNFPSWFRPDFKQFAGNVDRLPVDQHLLVCLCAPRAFMDTEGTKDAHCNPEGAQVSNLAARNVYKFLKAEDKISISTRPVGHTPSAEDVMDMADHVFNGKKLPEQIGKLVYKEETKPYFSWDLPK